MRTIPAYISERLNKNIQTRANKSAPSASLWVGRPTTVMVDDTFLERQTVISANAKDVSIAVCHPKVNSGNTRIYMAYISDGVARVVSAAHKYKMSAHIWKDAGFSEEATAVSIAYDGTMPKAIVGDVEFVTEQKPWVFWVNGGALYGQKLGEETVLLSETNCADVSAIRAMWSSAGGFDFGLVVFFLLSGKLYYRQLIGGVWMDAELVSFGPNVTWSEIAAFRTWDYRIGVQAKTTDGKIYEMFTQFMGVGKQLTEHLAVDVEPKANYVAIDYTDVKTEEHIEAHVSASGCVVYGLSSVPVSARNVDDGTGNYGTTIFVELDYPVTNVDDSAANFFLADSNGNSYICTDVRGSEDGLTLILTFVDFNQADGTTLTLDYVPGTIMSPATAMESFSYTFSPENLEAVDIPAPEPVEAWNLNSEGTEVAIRFSYPLVGDVTGRDTPLGYAYKSIDLSAATITSLNHYSSNPPSMAADGDISTFWRGSTGVNWIKFQLVEPKVVTNLRLYMGSYYIKTFTVSGSNDGETWNQLGGEYTGASSTTLQWYDIPIENDQPYLYYRIDTLTAYSSSRIYLYEVELQEYVAIGNETRIVATGQTYEYVPGGELEPASRTVIAVSETSENDPEDGAVIYLKFASGNMKSLRNMVGPVSIAYSGGTLRGLGGPVADFVFEFVPTGLEPKYHPNVDEHIESEIKVDAMLTRIYYTDLSESEHIEAVVTPVGNLISIDDI